ncbi:MAG: hypothetical protein QOC98_2243 [Frankiaceae bacterium]|nr:hypothetical protein [Frankiaceae bacterium]
MFEEPRSDDAPSATVCDQPGPGAADVFDRALAEGTPGLESLELLLSVDPSSMRRADGVSALIGAEKAMRLLAALALQFQAVVAGTQPGGRKIDEALHEVATTLNLHPATAAAKVATARGVVGRLPTTLKRLEAGELSMSQVQKIERAVRGLDVTVAQAVEADAVPGSVRGLGRRLETALARHAPEALARRTEQRRRKRDVSSWTDAVEGLAGLGVQGPAEMIAEIKSAIDLDARLRVAGECRSLNVRRFDVLRDWARERLGLVPLYRQPVDGPQPTDEPSGTSGGSQRRRKRKRRRGDPHRPAHRRCGTCGRAGPNRIPINVTVTLETLLRLSDTAGELDGVPIPADVARELAHDGDWTKWVVEPGGGRFLWAGAKTYRPGRRLARHVRGRDVTCRGPGCTTPAVHCDLDHVKAFHTEGGETVEENLADLCPTHHCLKHETNWNYVLLPDGTARWTSPCGRTYDDPPEHHDDDPSLNAYLAADSERRRHRDSARNRRIANKTRKLSNVFAVWETPPAGPRDDLPF